ncbi:7-cyano-7-deazaguanine synthase [Robbsia sp. KACC 23696]|uniref:7-cyano-7-deazaguanine synthase n=1 Tax=Robbsia sp. KACC 23696 TaxID=3149231 RepID=UPI00325B455F
MPNTETAPAPRPSAAPTSATRPVRGTDGLVGEGALVLFSGGQDSATCLAWALQRFARVETIGFDYGQRHKIELTCRDAFRAQLLAAGVREDRADAALSDVADGALAQDALGADAPFAAWSGRLGADHMIDLSLLGQISDTAMTREIEIAMRDDGLPNTFVPGRNLLFLTVAATVAYRRGLRVLVGGMCETDYSGYPDCRDDTLKALQVALNLGMDRRMVLQTPLMWLDKAATWGLAEQMGGATLVDLVRDHTHTCYVGDRTHFHPWGYGCGACPACHLRANGYAAYRGESQDPSAPQASAVTEAKK